MHTSSWSFIFPSKTLFSKKFTKCLNLKWWRFWKVILTRSDQKEQGAKGWAEVKEGFAWEASWWQWTEARCAADEVHGGGPGASHGRSGWAHRPRWPHVAHGVTRCPRGGRVPRWPCCQEGSGTLGSSGTRPQCLWKSWKWLQCIMRQFLTIVHKRKILGTQFLKVQQKKKNVSMRIFHGSVPGFSSGTRGAHAILFNCIYFNPTAWLK